jgi:hypothetical protein
MAKETVAIRVMEAETTQLTKPHRSSNAMSVNKHKPGMESRQTDRLLLMVLRHARKTSEDVQAMLRNARYRAPKARPGPGVGSTGYGRSMNIGPDHRGARFALLSRLTQRIFAMVLGDHLGSG